MQSLLKRFPKLWQLRELHIRISIKSAIDNIVIYIAGGNMGFIRNIALKTAIKKALLDVTSQIEEMGRRLPEISSFGELVMIYAKYSPHIDKNVLGNTWESTFYGLIATHAQNEMPSSYLIQDQRELAILTSLVTEWVASKGGNVANIYKEFSEAGLRTKK